MYSLDIGPLPKHLRESIFMKYEGICQYCGESVSALNFNIDHFYPVSLGGDNRVENLVLACRYCNAFKLNTSPEELVKKIRRVFDDLNNKKCMKKSFEELKLYEKKEHVAKMSKVTPSFIQSKLVEEKENIQKMKEVQKKRDEIFHEKVEKVLGNFVL